MSPRWPDLNDFGKLLAEIMKQRIYLRALGKEPKRLEVSRLHRRIIEDHTKRVGSVPGFERMPEEILGMTIHEAEDSKMPKVS